ncbi:MAG TPA: FAD-dependent oxidoreductase, partial [Caldilineaceae bacterium]|nr:FAD-dependent oxidoreductase [Caldilineaceae bacterium]
MSSYDYDVVVVGTGPGGYVAAIRAAQLGLKTAVVERESLGGVCLNWGCIPTKALIHNAEVLETLHAAKDFGFTFDNLQVDWGAAVKRSRDVAARQNKGVAFLMRKNKIDVIEGHAAFKDPHTLEVQPSEFLPNAQARTVSAANFIVAVGARARGLPGIEMDGDRIIQYRDALVLDEVPKRMIVVGSGAIGMEFGYVYHTYGSEITIVEMLDQLLPLEDPEVSGEVTKAFQKSGIKTLVSTRTEGVERTENGVRVTVKNLKSGVVETLEADKVLMAV